MKNNIYASRQLAHHDDFTAVPQDTKLSQVLNLEIVSQDDHETTLASMRRRQVIHQGFGRE
jgi:hypothetical protein